MRLQTHLVSHSPASLRYCRHLSQHFGPLQFPPSPSWSQVAPALAGRPSCCDGQLSALCTGGEQLHRWSILCGRQLLGKPGGHPPCLYVTAEKWPEPALVNLLYCHCLFGSVWHPGYLPPSIDRQLFRPLHSRWQLSVRNSYVTDENHPAGVVTVWTHYVQPSPCYTS